LIFRYIKILAVVGIVVGGSALLIGIGLLLFLVLFIKRRKQKKRTNQKKQNCVQNQEQQEGQNSFTFEQQDSKFVTITDLKTRTTNSLPPSHSLSLSV
jgi:hypothetical protein